MLHIKCPHCGLRSQNEFSYGGDATVKRPELNKEVSDEDWDNFVYLRKSPVGKHLELWPVSYTHLTLPTNREV